jgi:predicted nucleotidyltransferase
MTLPLLNPDGELPEGVHRASLEEVLERFGQGTSRRRLVTARLLRVFGFARDTSKLERFVIFGSYVTAEPNPNDVDIILVMRDDFTEDDYDPEVFPLFDHLRAQRELGVSLFVIGPSFIFGEAVDEFVRH